MPELTTKQLYVTLCLVAILLTAGFAVGKTFANSVDNSKHIEKIQPEIVTIQTEFAFIRGVIVTDLASIKEDIKEIKERIK